MNDVVKYLDAIPWWAVLLVIVASLPGWGIEMVNLLERIHEYRACEARRNREAEVMETSDALDCKNAICDASLRGASVRIEAHPDGWDSSPASDLTGKVWVAVECPKCGTAYSLEKLGVPQN